MRWLRYRNKLNPHILCFSAGEVGHRLQGLPFLHRQRPCARWQVLRLWCLGAFPSDRKLDDGKTETCGNNLKLKHVETI